LLASPGRTAWAARFAARGSGFSVRHCGDPDTVGQALQQIGALYAIEEHIREHKLRGERRLWKQHFANNPMRSDLDSIRG